MKPAPLDLNDLCPKETTFKLDNVEAHLTLCRWSLRVRKWAVDTYGSEGLREIFDQRKINEIGSLAYFMLKEKSRFPFDHRFRQAHGLAP